MRVVAYTPAVGNGLVADTDWVGSHGAEDIPQGDSAEAHSLRHSQGPGIPVDNLANVDLHSRLHLLAVGVAEKGEELQALQALKGQQGQLVLLVLVLLVLLVVQDDQDGVVRDVRNRAGMYEAEDVEDAGEPVAVDIVGAVAAEEVAALVVGPLRAVAATLLAHEAASMWTLLWPRCNSTCLVHIC
mmetsp:Transcript_27718/g.64421  ORF Transcript_27718/g.64421 Transcript_27718/m.64421 type:complete len:186 (+) Transcript_27718:483-1040(+)